MALRTIVLSTSIVVGFGMKAHAESRTIDIAGFDEVEVSAGIVVDVTVGADYGISAEAWRGDLDRLEIEKHGDRLIISRKVGWGLLSASRRDRFAVTISMPALSEVEASSGSEMSVNGAKMLTRVDGSSGAIITLDEMDLDRLRIDVSSGANLDAEGRCRDLRAQASSGANVDLRGLTCKIAEISASSGAALRASASETAEVAASSGGSIALWGGAEVIREDVSSAGSVSIR